MFIYEDGNSLNLTFDGTMPVQNPDVTIKGFVNGATVTVNGTEVVSIESAKEFENKAQLIVFQRDGKLMITFNGLQGLEAPEVTIDEVSENTYNVVANGQEISLVVVDNRVEVATEEPDDDVVEVTEPEVIDEPEVTQEPDEEEEAE